MLSVAIRRRRPDFELAVQHDFPLGGITAIFGPSGCGKTTLLRSIAGLERGAVGRIAHGDEVWQDERGGFVPPHRRGVGFAFQEARLFPHLRVEGNLRYADRRSRDHVARGFEFDAVVAALDLADLLLRRPGGLSAGERQRVAIARTLLARPRLLLMDEPLASLDSQRKAEILPAIAKLPTTFGVPILYVTHSLDEVAQLADRMFVLAAGRAIAEGAVGEVLERLDLDSAEFGDIREETSSLLDARVVGRDERYRLTRLDLAGQSLVMPEGDFPIGELVRLRLRARDVALATRRPEQVSIRNVLNGRVIDLRADPDSAYADVMVDVGGAHLRARITREAVDALGLAQGVPVFALIKSLAVDRRVRAPGAETRRAPEAGD
jgi:molybdate transport system ATP-binding protein